MVAYRPLKELNCGCSSTGSTRQLNDNKHGDEWTLLHHHGKHPKRAQPSDSLCPFRKDPGSHYKKHEIEESEYSYSDGNNVISPQLYSRRGETQPTADDG